MKVRYFIFSIFIITFVLCNCSHTIKVSRSAPEERFSEISSVEKIFKAEITQKNGEKIDAKNVDIDRDRISFINSETGANTKIPTKNISIISIKKPGFFERLFFRSYSRYSINQKARLATLTHNNGNKFKVHDLIASQDSTLYFLSYTDELQIIPTFQINQIAINRPRRCNTTFGIIGLVIGGVGGYFIADNMFDDSSEVISAFFDPIFKIGITGLGAIAGAKIGTSIGRNISKDTYIFIDTPIDTTQNNF